MLELMDKIRITSKKSNKTVLYRLIEVRIM